MLILLTSAGKIEKEADILNRFLELGLQYLHIRKPNCQKEGYKNLLLEIDPKFYNRIVIHQYHELVQEFPIRGIHLQEHARRSLGNQVHQFLQLHRDKGIRISTSFHCKLELQMCAKRFDYSFLSPVFDSISKKNYAGKNFDVSELKSKIIALGGVHPDTLCAAYQKGYFGVAVMGSIWNREAPYTNFIHTFNKYNSIFAN